MTKSKAPQQNKKCVLVVRWEKQSPLTQEEAEARLHQEGYESYCWYDVPRVTYPKHQHGVDECIWILKGEIQFQAEGESYALKSGDRIYLPAQLAHTAVVATQGVTYLVGQKRN